MERAVDCLRRSLAAAAAIALFLWPSTATPSAHASVTSYDAPAIAHVDAHESEAVEAGIALLSDTRERSVSPPVEPSGASTTPVSLSNATNTVDEIAGLADDYIDVTAKGSRVRNVRTSTSRSSFEQNLIDRGYQPTLVSPQKNVVSYELNGKRYVVRDAATTTGGPTADFYPAGSSTFTLKIRLAE